VVYLEILKSTPENDMRKIFHNKKKKHSVVRGYNFSLS